MMKMLYIWAASWASQPMGCLFFIRVLLHRLRCIYTMSGIYMLPYWPINMPCANHRFLSFYSASAWLAMQSAVLARAILSVRPSVCMSVRHTPVLCPDKWRYDRAVSSIW